MFYNKWNGEIMKKIEQITNKELEYVEKEIKKDIKYGREGILIDSALKQFPLNNDISTVAMKVCLIDLTNGTNLSRNLGKSGGIYELAKKITEINFDKRISVGDTTIVNELAKWTKENIGKNLFSFITKYCLYHNVHCYNKDDFVIYDSVVAENLSRYISDEDYKTITGKNLHKNSLKKCKYNFNYEEYKNIIDFIIKKNNLKVDKPHRKIDWFIWYKNRG